MDDGNFSEPRICNAEPSPGCKVFHISRADGSQGSEVPLAADLLESHEVEGHLKDQVLVFQYRGKFHAIDHVSQ